MKRSRPPSELEDACVELLRSERSRAESAEQRLKETAAANAGLSARNEELEERIQKLKDDKITSLASDLAGCWLTKRRSPGCAESVLCEDPIYGKVEIDRRLLPIYLHPLVQRLNYVRDLSFAYLVFPSASHTRLSHILGVMRNAGLALRTVFHKDRLYRRGRNVPDQIALTRQEQDRYCLKAELCALLHDIGHGPFGHALDKPMSYLASAGELPDKFFSAEYVRNVLRDEILQAGFSVDEVLDILVKERRKELSGWDVFLAELIDSSLDVDRLDYLPRDAHMTGLAMGSTNVQALIEHMCPFDNGKQVFLAFEKAALPHLEHLLYAHHIMYINCYEHPVKLCAERLLARLVDFALRKGVTKGTLMLLTDEQLLTVLGHCVPEDGAERECLRCIQENRSFHPVAGTPYELSKAVWDPAGRGIVFRFNESLNEEIEGWYRRRPQGETQLEYVFREAPESWERRICEGAKLLPEADYWMVVVTVPAYEAKQAEESGTRVLLRTPSGFDLEDLYDISPVNRAVITNLIPAREVIHVLACDEMDPGVAKGVAEASEAFFKRRQEEVSADHPPPAPTSAPPPP